MPQQEWTLVNNQLELQSPTEPTLAAPRRNLLKSPNFQESIGLVGILAILVIFLAIKSPYFLSAGNFLNILTNVSTVGIIAIAMTIVIVSGGLDLSVGSVVALTGVAVAQLSHSASIGVAVGAALLIGIFVGGVNGVAITKVGINPLITTLGTLSIVRGLALVFSNGLSQSIENEAFLFLGRGKLFGLPTQVAIMLILALAAAWIMRATVYGRSIYAIGGNAQASRLAGLPVVKLQMSVYVLSGLAAALGGLVSAAMTGAGAPASAQGIELSVIAAVILGGTSLTGGKGTIWGTMLGVLILGTLNNGLT
ncbi:ABC transporter permease, partial [bacterium]